jgi:hypothetical protein
MSELVPCWHCGEEVSTLETVCPHCGQSPKKSTKAAYYPLKIVGVFAVVAAVVVVSYTLLIG